MSPRARAWTFLLALALSGCTIEANLNTGYRPDTTTLRETPLPATLAVRRFRDERPPRIYSTNGRGFMTYVPFIPYVALPFERIDETAFMIGKKLRRQMPPFEEFTYPASMARAIAEDLTASGVFKSVRYVGEDPTDGYRYVLSGVLRASPVETDMTSYGLGIVGVYFWLLPIPVGQTWTSVTLDLTLTDTEKGETVWQNTVSHDYAKWVTLYTSAPNLVYGGKTSFGFVQIPRTAQVDRDSLFSWNFEALRQAMATTRAAIAAAVARQP